MGGLHINEISFALLIGLYSVAIGESLDVVLSCRFCGQWMREFFSSFFPEHSVDFNRSNRGYCWYVKRVWEGT